MYSNHLPRKPKDTKPKRPPKVHPNIEAIFNTRYRVILNQMDTTSVAERREFGAVSTGNKNIDKAMAVSYITVFLTIDDMLENYLNGIPMRLDDPRDSKKIFEAITNHTGAWRQELRHAINMGEAPVEDLINLENFATSIYERAKFVYVERPKMGEFAVGSLAAFLYSDNAIQGTVFNSNTGRHGGSYATRTRADVKEDKHNPNIEVFRDMMMTQMAWADSNE